MVLYDYTPVSQIAKQVDHEQRIPLRPGVEHGRQLVRKLVSGKGQREVTIEVAAAQKRQGDFSTKPAALEFKLNRPKWMLTSQKIGWAIGQDQKHPPRRASHTEIG